MILPGLEPHHTRQSFSSRSRVYVEKHVPTEADYIKTENGLWLLPEALARRDAAAAEVVLGRLADAQHAEGMAGHEARTVKGLRILGRTTITSAGCMVGGLRGNQAPAEWTKQFGEWEWGGPAFNEPDELEHIRACDCDECYNPRHYDLEFGRATLRERKVELNPRYYSEKEDGTIQTIWGDKLPSVRDSLAAYIELQQRNYPHVAPDKSPLTTSSMAQIRFHPTTGCWEAWQYYCKPEENLNWQFDGYGRLYQRLATQTIDKQTGEITPSKRRGHWMAHRVVWAATGGQFAKGEVLNHLCSYRRCCNPGHIEQVSYSENVVHGRRVQKAIAGLKAANGIQALTVFIHPRELSEKSQQVQEMYHELSSGKAGSSTAAV